MQFFFNFYFEKKKENPGTQQPTILRGETAAAVDFSGIKKFGGVQIGILCARGPIEIFCTDQIRHRFLFFLTSTACMCTLVHESSIHHHHLISLSLHVQFFGPIPSHFDRPRSSCKCVWSPVSNNYKEGPMQKKKKNIGRDCVLDNFPTI